MLAEVGQAASLNLPKETRVPISASHIQSLITYALVGDETRNFPFSWVLKRKQATLYFNLISWNNILQDI